MASQTILNHSEINNKLRRIAFQIYESNVTESEVVLAGIDKNGFIIAKKLKTIITKISPLNIVLCQVAIDKENPQKEIKTSINSEDYANKSMVLIDDVLHSGTTLIYGVKHFLEVPLKQFKTVVLVNRNHKKYPVKADYKGISLSTSINKNVTVILDGPQMVAFLE